MRCENIEFVLYQISSYLLHIPSSCIHSFLHTAGRLYYAAIAGERVHPEDAADGDADSDALAALHTHSSPETAAHSAGPARTADSTAVTRGNKKEQSPSAQTPVLTVQGRSMRFNVPASSAAHAELARGYRTPRSCNAADELHFEDSGRARVLLLNSHGRTATVPCARTHTHARGAETEFQVLPCQLRGAAAAHAGVKGWMRRNMTPFARIVAIVVVLLFLLMDLFLF